MCHQVYREVTLVLGGRDAANYNFTLAVALCAEEDGRNCSWFLDTCKRAGVHFDGIPIFTDRGKGLCLALKTSISGAIVCFCTRHILRNIKATFRANVPTDIESVLYRVQAAEILDEYKSVLATLMKSCSIDRHRRYPYRSAIVDESSPLVLATPSSDTSLVSFMSSSSSAELT